MYKSKYSRIFKMKLAKLHSEEMSSYHLSELFGISSRQIRYWRYVYTLHGANSFQGPASTSTASNKLFILKQMWANNWTINHTSAVFNLSSPGILSKWQTDYDIYGLEGFKLRRQGRLMKTPPAPPQHKTRRTDVRERAS